MSYDLTVVVHCWRYARLWRYQLAALADYYADIPLRVMAFVADDASPDPATDSLLRRHAGGPFVLDVHRQPLDHLFNRAIGRNYAAAEWETSAWWWFADADYVPGPVCLRRVLALSGEEPLYYPDYTLSTLTHKVGQVYVDSPRLEILDPCDFEAQYYTVAVGGLQFCPGWALAQGYCQTERRQRPNPSGRMDNFTSDRQFRVDLGTPGCAVDLSDLRRIRHLHAGYLADDVHN